MTWYVDISVIINDFVPILTHCLCNYLFIRPFLFEFLPFVHIKLSFQYVYIDTTFVISLHSSDDRFGYTSNLIDINDVTKERDNI